MKETIAKLLKKVFAEKGIEVSSVDIEKNIEIPPSSDLGDYSFPCFSLKEKLKGNPSEIANDIKIKFLLQKILSKFKQKGHT